MRQQSGMGIGHIGVVGLDRDGFQDRRDETLTLLPPAPFRQLHTNLQLGNGDRCNGDIVAIGDRFDQGVAAALGIDQDSRVED